MKKRITAFALVLALLFGMMPVSTSSAAKKVSLSSKKLKVTVGKSKKLKLKNNKKKVSWKVTSGKKNISLKGKSKKGVTIKGKKKGSAKVQAKVGKKKYTCKVTVTAKKPSSAAKETPIVSGDDSGITPSGDPAESTSSPSGDNPTNTPSGNNPTNTPSGNNPTNTPSGNNPTNTPSWNDPTNTPSWNDPTNTPSWNDPTNTPSWNNPTNTPSWNDPTATPSESNPTAVPTATPTAKPKVPGEEIDLGDKTPFAIGTQKIALGISKADTLKALGSDASVSDAKSPQGYGVIVYNPDDTYDGYTLIYLNSDDTVVSICAVGTTGTVSYGDIVKTGDMASALTAGNGWTSEGWFEAMEGTSSVGNGAYRCTAVNANVLAYVDYHRDSADKANQKVYSIQVYANTENFDNLTKPSKCTYNDAVTAAMATQTAEFLIAYRISCEYTASDYLNVVDEARKKTITLNAEEGLAEAARDFIQSNKFTMTDKPTSIQSEDDLLDAIVAKNKAQGQDATKHYGQIVIGGRADSIGCANAIIEEKSARAYIAKVSNQTKTSGSGGKIIYYYYFYQYLGVAVRAEGNYACMVVDLTDRWYDSEPKWYVDKNDEDDDFK